MLSFNAIPVGIRTPGSFVEFDSTRAAPNLAPWTTRIMVMGQMLGTGVAAVNTAVRISQLSDATTAFGVGSMLEHMVKALLATNSVTELWAMAVLENAGGTAATKTLTFTVGPTAAGTLPLYVAGKLLSIAVTAGESVTAVAAAVSAAINADTSLPYTAAPVVGVVTLTARWKGLSGNDIDVRTAYATSDVMPAGLAVTIAAGVAGAGNPDVTNALAALGDVQYHFIAFPWTDATNLGLLATELATRRGPLVQMESVAFCSAKGSQGSLATLGGSMNSPDISISECVGPSTTWGRCAKECGTIAFYGSIDPARPFQTLALLGALAASPSERFTRAQRDILLHDGISTHTVDQGGNVMLERPITTYQVSPAGFADPSYLDVNTMLTLGYLRYTLRARIALKYPRHKLADDGIAIAPGQAIVTPKTLTAELVALAGDWEAAGLVENLDQFRQLLIVERDANDPSRVNALVPPDIVSGLRVFAAQIQFAF
jgi:phage tail sheath gpL-like